MNGERCEASARCCKPVRDLLKSGLVLDFDLICYCVCEIEAPELEALDVAAVDPSYSLQENHPSAQACGIELDPRVQQRSELVVEDFGDTREATRESDFSAFVDSNL